MFSPLTLFPLSCSQSVPTPDCIINYSLRSFTDISLFLSLTHTHLLGIYSVYFTIGLKRENEIPLTEMAVVFKDTELHRHAHYLCPHGD